MKFNNKQAYIIETINTATVTGGYTLQAKLWKGHEKERIYVTVTDSDGKPQPESLYIEMYIENRGIFWDWEPDPRPDWMDEVVNVIWKAVGACAPDGQ